MSQFGRSNKTRELAAGTRLEGRIAVLTGATSALGREVARTLAAAGAELILPTRDIERGSALADDLITQTGNSKIRNYEMDLADFDSVRRFAENFMSEYPQVDLLINLAETSSCSLQRSVHGLELQLAVNYFGHFLLTTTLGPALAASAACRVLSLSSPEHRLSPVVFDDLHFDRRPYDSRLAYAQTKTATALFALSLNERLQEHGGSAFAVSGVAARTPGAASAKGKAAGRFRALAQAAATVTWAATAPHLAAHGGAYCENCEIAQMALTPEASRGVWPHARDSDAAAKLWELSERLVDQPLRLRDPRVPPGLMTSPAVASGRSRR